MGIGIDGVAGGIVGVSQPLCDSVGGFAPSRKRIVARPSFLRSPCPARQRYFGPNEGDGLCFVGGEYRAESGADTLGKGSGVANLHIAVDGCGDLPYGIDSRYGLSYRPVSQAICEGVCR